LGTRCSGVRRVNMVIWSDDLPRITHLRVLVSSPSRGVWIDFYGCFSTAC
jgi:hypothetical protein